MEKKFICNSDGEWGKWEDLNPEILALIMLRIPAEERVATASLVCKSWMSCVLGPFCWSDIDIQDWYRRRHLAVEYVDSAVRKLVRRRKGTFRRLSAFRLGDSGFAFAANWYCCSLLLFRIFFIRSTKKKKSWALFCFVAERKKRKGHFFH